MRLIFGLVLTLILCACSENPQVLSPKKVTQPAYMGAHNPYVEKGWTPGDKASWEAQLKARAQGQNEYSRVE
jgi:hypothetical protein